MAMTWRPPDDLHEDLRVIAFHTRRSINDLVTEAVREWVERKGRAMAQEAAARRAKR